MTTKRVHARVYGRVQGVWYRQSTKNEADRLGLSGWVRNRADGTVELECAGEGKQVDELLVWLHQGPPAARVERVDVEELPQDANAEPDFQVWATV